MLLPIHERKDDMSYIYAAIGSVTTATRLSRELMRRGVSADVVHTPSEINSGGCSYSVRLPAQNRDILEQTALEKRYKIRRLYGRDKENSYYDIS